LDIINIVVKVPEELTIEKIMKEARTPGEAYELCMIAPVETKKCYKEVWEKKFKREYY
jgi:hypothetical protein